jgi:hypothetical protein
MPEGYLKGFTAQDSKQLGEDLVVKFYERNE